MADKNKMTFYANQADGIIKKLKLRKMEGYYVPTMEEAKVFLRKKDLLTEEPILYASMDPQRPLDNLDVPEKIRAYIRNLKLQDGD